jgi:hypothetical protein
MLAAHGLCLKAVTVDHGLPEKVAAIAAGKRPAATPNNGSQIPK